MTLSLSISNIVDSVLASSALAHRLEIDTPAMLSAVNRPALRRVAVMAFANVAATLSTHGCVDSISLPPDEQTVDILSIDIAPSDSHVNQQILLSLLENAVTFAMLDICYDSLDSKHTGFRENALNIVSALASKILSPRHSLPRIATLKRHYY